jgi:predicted nucleic-acid-binding protein
MIAFDTSLLVRFLVEDDQRQLRLTLETLACATERRERVLVSDVVLSELEWVLDAAYKVPRKQILVAVQSLVEDGRFCFENASRLAMALQRYQHGKGDLSDYLLGARAREGGAATTFTFDRGLRRDDLFTVLD